MKLSLRSRHALAATRRRGAALLLSLLILFVLVAIVFQISIGTTVDSRVARNDIALTTMDLAVESAMLEVHQLLIADAEGADAGGDEEGLGGDPGADPAAGGEDSGDLGADPLAQEGGGGEAVDSRRDEYMRPSRTEINSMQLRILVQDEDSKFNLLNLANPEEAEADFAKEQLIRLFDLFREDTDADINRSQAEEMAEDVRDFMLQRAGAILPNPKLLTTDEENEDLGFPLTVRELCALESFDLGMFRDFRDEEGKIAHSLSTFLTVWTSLAPASEVVRPPEGSEEAAAAERAAASEGEVSTTAENGGGFAVNINTAPIAVLKCLFEDRDVPHRFWDEVVEYRNLEDEDEEDRLNSEEEDVDPPLDEFGEEIIQRKIFEDLGKLSELETWDRLDDDVRPLVESRLRTTSDVFSIYITARRATSQEDEFAANSLGTARERREQEVESGTALLRTVRSVVWRRVSADGEVEIVPLVRWEVIDYVPFEVLDYPEDER